MSAEQSHSPSLIDWAVATLALPGQAESGDRHLVKPVPNGVLVAAVDGLGHGPAAAAAARIAVEILERHAAPAGDLSLTALVRRCHEGLLNTRGVVMSLAAFNGLDGTMAWLGVGNVEGVLLRADAGVMPRREAVMLRGGVVGYQLPPLRTSVLPVTRSDTLILATDGIRSGFAEGLTRSDSPQQIADRVLADYGKGTDDALVLVARYLGGAQ
jgi:phosphoserine phosphatase RsbX